MVAAESLDDPSSPAPPLRRVPPLQRGRRPCARAPRDPARRPRRSRAGRARGAARAWARPEHGRARPACMAARGGVAGREQSPTRSHPSRSTSCEPAGACGSGDARGRARPRRGARGLRKIPRRAADGHARDVRAHRDRGRERTGGRERHGREPRHDLRATATHAQALGRSPARTRRRDRRRAARDAGGPLQLRRRTFDREAQR